MIPIHLSVSGFLSYRDPAELDFTKFDLACISGENGAGKSALLDAITFALFGQARKSDESLINSNRDVSAAEVTFTFAHEGNTYRVQRLKPKEKTALLEFQIKTADNRWKALTERTMRDTEMRIQETLRLDYETFVNASFFLQGKADQFTQQRPTDRKRILGSILGLEIWEQYRQSAAERRKALEGEVGTIDGRLAEINQELGEEERRKARLKDLEAQLKTLSNTRAAQESVLKGLRQRAAAVEQQATLVATLATQLQRTQGQLADLQARLGERQKEQQGYADLKGRAKEVEKAYSAWQKLREELSTWEEVAGRFHEQEKQRREPLNEISVEKARLETELAALKSEQLRVEEALVDRPFLLAELKTVNAKIKTIETKLANRGKVEQQLNAARKDHADAVGENPLLHQEMIKLRARIDQLKEATGPTCPTCGQPLTEEHRKETVTVLENEGTQMGDRFRANKQKQESTSRRVQDLEAAFTQFGQHEEELRDHSVNEAKLNKKLEDLETLENLWKSEAAPRLEEIETSMNNETFAEKARAELSKIDEQLKTTGYDAAQHDAVRKAEQQARSSEADMRALEQAQAASKPLEREIKELEKQIAEQEKGVADQQMAHDQAAKALAAAQTGLPDVQNAERGLLEAQEQENRLRLEVGSAQQEVAVLETLRVRTKDMQAQREDLSTRVAQYQSLERAFGKDGVPAMLIEQALPQIEAKANAILERLSTGPMHITFQTQQEYKDKRREDRRETLEIQISDSVGRRDYEMFSGGDRKSVV